MPDHEIIHLPSAGSIPGFPGSHGPGNYEADYTTRTLRRVVNGVPIDEPGEASEDAAHAEPVAPAGLYLIGEPDSHHAAQGALEVLQAPESAPDAPVDEPASVSSAEPETTPAPSEAQPEAEAEAQPAAAEEAQPDPAEPAPDEAHE